MRLSRWLSLLLFLISARASTARPITMNERIADAELRKEGLHTIQDRFFEYRHRVESRMQPYFEMAEVPYPPTALQLVAIKDEKVLQLYASANGPYHLIRSYPILAASGTAGPKTCEGDKQVPEGIYAIEKLNPNSAYHLALRVAYPNDFDREQARLDGRNNLGGDIMIHGGARSAGCLAMGDTAAEDLFILAADVGVTKVKLIISPIDFRKTNILPPDTKHYPWSGELYRHIRRDLSVLSD